MHRRAKFPGANHIGVLANTIGWKTDENLQKAKDAMTHCYSLIKDVEGYIMFRKPKEYGGSFMRPFNYGWQSLNPVDMAGLQWMIDNPNPLHIWVLAQKHNQTSRLGDSNNPTL